MSTDIELLPCPFCGGAASVGPTRTSYIVECNNASCGVNPDALATFKHGAVDAWNRRATPLAPTPAAPEGQAEAEEWMRKAIAATRTAARLFNEGGFSAGMETACDEIETRMARDGDTLPRQAAVREAPEDAPELALNTMHKLCHQAADAFWTYWNENGETHKRGYYESTWGAINRAIRMVGVVPHKYNSPAPDIGVPAQTGTAPGEQGQ